jgi:hypothetical protein
MLDSLNSQTDNSTLYIIDPAIIKKTKAKLSFKYHEFLNIFNRSKADELPSHRFYNHKIKLEREGQPSKSRLYPMSGYKLQKIKEYLTKNLKKGFITLNKTLYASPILFTEKKDGSLRFYMNYRRLNALIKRDKYLISLINEILAKIQGFKYLTQLNIITAFNKLRMNSDSENLIIYYYLFILHLAVSYGKKYIH